MADNPSAVLLFGGSFDPIHHGHLIVARAVAERLSIPRIVLIPSARPPHKLGNSLASAADRVEMCRLAVAGDLLFEVSDWETRQEGPNYTLLTVRHFQTALPDTRIFWLVGTDSLNELHTWYHVDELAKECTVITAGRPGFEPELTELARRVDSESLARLRGHVLETPRIGISATEIRARVAAGRSTSFLSPEPVCKYILHRGLYASR